MSNPIDFRPVILAGGSGTRFWPRSRRAHAIAVQEDHDFANDLRRGHPGYAAFGPDLRGNTLEGHDGNCTGSLGDFRLLRRGDVHYDAAFEHLGEAGFQAKTGSVVSVVLRHDVSLHRLGVVPGFHVSPLRG